MGWLKSICCLLTLAFLAPAAFAAAPIPSKLVPIPPVGPSPITPDCRYLFVVDLSSAMQRIADGLYRTTHRLVASGLGGRMQEGDVFTIWTYADTVLTREFPLNAWTPDLNISLANRTHEFLAQQKFRGTSNLRPVFAELGQARAISPNLTVILISDGTDVVVGTPFDRPINITYGTRASEMRSAKMPFITSLVTQRGEFTQWAVRGGLEDIGLSFPEKPILPASVIVQTPIVVTPAPTPPAAPALVVFKPLAPTNLPPVVVAKAPEPAIPKPASPLPAVAPSPVPKPATNAVVLVLPTPPKPPEPAPAAPAKKVEQLPPPVTVPQPEAKVALPPPKSVPVESKPPTAAPKPEVKPPTVALVLQPTTPVLQPELRPHESLINTSTTLTQVEGLRPPSVKPPKIQVIEPKLAPPQATNTAVTVPPTEPTTSESTTNSLAHTNAPTRTAKENPVESAVPLAIVSPRMRNGGWLYLAAAVALLVLAGGVITRLLRPGPQPSAISQSMDKNRR